MRKKISSKVIRSVPLITDNVFKYFDCSNTTRTKTDNSSAGFSSYTWTLHKIHVSSGDVFYPAKYLDSLV